jgi:adenylate kinase
MRVIIMGPQGAGKGTQAAKLEEELGTTHIETGDLVRSETKSETELGQKIKEYGDKGELVPDELIIEMTKPYLEKNYSWILDGFPRNKEQAQALDEALNEIGEKVIVIRSADEELVERLSGRRLSEATGEVYHIEYNPRRGRAATRTRAHLYSARTTPSGLSGPGWITTTSRPSR